MYFTFLNIIILLCVIVFPMAWLRSEFIGKRGIRITLGIISHLTCFGFAAIVSLLFNLFTGYHYGEATKKLIEKTINELEHGDKERVIFELRRLHDQYHPTYERDYYENYVTETSNRMNSKATSDTQKNAAIKPSGIL